MKINFVSLAGDDIASFRYRVYIPAMELANRHEVSISQKPYIDSEVVVFSKHFHSYEYDLLLMAKKLGMKTVYDVCDYHDKIQEIMDHNAKMIASADMLTCANEGFREISKPDAIVIDDPYEFDEDTPKFSPGEKFKILWYGNIKNFNAIINIWDSIKGNFFMAISDPRLAESTNIQITPWSKPNMLDGLSRCDLVIIPVDKDNTRKRLKSTNRVVEAIRRGRFVIADDIPPYRQFSTWMWIGDIGKGMEFARNNKEEIPDRIREAQKYVADRFSPERIGRQWEDALCAVKQI